MYHLKKIFLVNLIIVVFQFTLLARELSFDDLANPCVWVKAFEQQLQELGPNDQVLREIILNRIEENRSACKEHLANMDNKPLDMIRSIPSGEFEKRGLYKPDVEWFFTERERLNEWAWNEKKKAIFVWAGIVATVIAGYLIIKGTKALYKKYNGSQEPEANQEEIVDASENILI